MKVTIQKIKLWFRGLKRLWTLASIEDRLDYAVTREELHEQNMASRIYIDELDVPGRYYGLLHGDGHLDGMMKIQEDIKEIKLNFDLLKRQSNKNYDNIKILIKLHNDLAYDYNNDRDNGYSSYKVQNYSVIDGKVKFTEEDIYESDRKV